MPHAPTRNRIWTLAIGTLFVLFIGSALIGGLWLQKWFWNATAELHYQPDQTNAMRWALRSVDVGYLNVYESVIREKPTGDFGLDYPPLRLAVVAVWGHWLRDRFPTVTTASADLNVNWPFIGFNALLHLWSAVIAFLLVRMWQRSRWLLPAIAATWLWFNPAIWINAYGRAAGDAWLVPFYLTAIWLACTERWMFAGFTLGIGAMFKGQLLIVAPVFVLWPLMTGRLLAILRLLAGFALATALVVSPWMLTRLIIGPQGPDDDWHRTIDGAAVAWIGVALAIWIFILLTRRRWNAIVWLRITESIAAAGVLCWPAIAHRYFLLALALAALALVLVATLRRARPRVIVPMLSAWLAIVLYLCIPLFHGSTTWYRVGFEYGVSKYPQLEIGGSDCLAGILARSFKWNSMDVVLTIPSRWLWLWPQEPHPLTIVELMSCGIAIGLLASALAMALQQRRRSATFLVAMLNPWLIYFAFAPHMHERYLLWAAAISCCAAAIDWGYAGLSVLISLMSTMMTIQLLIASRASRRSILEKATQHDWLDTLLPQINHAYPGAGYAVMLMTMVVFYCSFKRLTTGRNSWRKSF